MRDGGSVSQLDNLTSPISLRGCTPVDEQTVLVRGGNVGALTSVRLRSVAMWRWWCQAV